MATNKDITTQAKGIRQTIAKMCVLAVAMFVFAMWVMPPIYTLFCEITGINGKTSGKAYQAVSADVDLSRVVRVQFVAANHSEMSWEFKPQKFSIDVHPGEAVTTFFDAHNPMENIMVGQAVPSLAPRNAIEYFHKTECFCFNSQVLGPNERAELGLQFIVDQDLPKSVRTITLSYSLFDITKNSPEIVEQKKKDMKMTKLKGQYSNKTIVANK